MEKKFYCPHCKAQLNIGNDIIFKAKNPKEVLGLVLVSPRIGDYSVLKDPLFTIEKGERLEVICPVCNKNLQTDKFNKNLAMVNLRDERGVESEVYFSEIFGEHCTYKITNKSIEMYGDDSSKYNFWGAAPNY